MATYWGKRTVTMEFKNVKWFKDVERVTKNTVVLVKRAANGDTEAFVAELASAAQAGSAKNL